MTAARREPEDCEERRPERLGPPPSGYALLPWLLMGTGAYADLWRGDVPHPWLGGLGILVFALLYAYVVFRAFDREAREAAGTRWALLAMGLVTCGLGLGYGGGWLPFFLLLGMATGAVVRGRPLGPVCLGLTVLAGATAWLRDGWDAVNVAYGTFLTTMLTAALLSLSEAVRELRAAREELARQAVEKERLRFSRDLHDLLGHTLSVIVVKSEAARRLAPRDVDAAVAQITDVESVGRQALTEVREAVTGYREGSLSTELDGARSLLTAAGVTPAVHLSGPPLPAQTGALLGWVVREAVTNVVRHSGADRCTVTLTGDADRVRLTVTDDGPGKPPARPTGGTGGSGGTGLRGLTERLAAAGGSLAAGPGPGGGFVVRAELPTEPAGSAAGG